MTSPRSSSKFLIKTNRSAILRWTGTSTGQRSPGRWYHLDYWTCCRLRSLLVVVYPHIAAVIAAVRDHGGLASASGDVYGRVVHVGRRGPLPLPIVAKPAVVAAARPIAAAVRPVIAAIHPAPFVFMFAAGRRARKEWRRL